MLARDFQLINYSKLLINCSNLHTARGRLPVSIGRTPVRGLFRYRTAGGAYYVSSRLAVAGHKSCSGDPFVCTLPPSFPGGWDDESELITPIYLNYYPIHHRSFFESRTDQVARVAAANNRFGTMLWLFSLGHCTPVVFVVVHRRVWRWYGDDTELFPTRCELVETCKPRTIAPIPVRFGEIFREWFNGWLKAIA